MRQMGLTVRMRDALGVIKAHIATHSTGPSMSVIQQKLGLKSRGRVHALMNSLKERGYIDWLPHRANSIQIIEREMGGFQLPRSLQDRLTDFCRRENEEVDNVIVDAIDLHLDEMERADG